ncbi:MAG TPA: hypothetical protein VMT43_08195, partial [Acidimicrobiales bacterium]|nr:hypothetical protein [Acidimicrobiales bacterium]
RDAMRAAMLDAGIEWVPSELNEGERKGVAKGSARVGDPAMVRRISSDRFRREAPPGSRVGFANQKGRKLVRAGVAVDADDTVVAALMAGDLHVAPPDTLDRIAEALVGADARDEGDLRARITSVFEADDVTQAEEVMGVTTDDLLTAVVKAVGVAQGSEPVATEASR